MHTYPPANIFPGQEKRGRIWTIRTLRTNIYVVFWKKSIQTQQNPGRKKDLKMGQAGIPGSFRTVSTCLLRKKQVGNLKFLRTLQSLCNPNLHPKNWDNIIKFTIHSTNGTQSPKSVCWGSCVKKCANRIIFQCPKGTTHNESPSDALPEALIHPSVLCPWHAASYRAVRPVILGGSNDQSWWLEREKWRKQLDDEQQQQQRNQTHGRFGGFLMDEEI